MRKITNLLLLLIVPTTFLLAQEQYERFTASSSGDATQTTELNKYYRDFQLVVLPFEAIDLLVHSTSKPAMQWVFPNGMYWDVALEAAPIRSADFTIRTLTKNGERTVPIDADRINTFRSAKVGLDIRMTINQEFIYGYYQEENGSLWYIEPAKRFAPTAATNQYVLYRTEDVLPVAGLKCGQTERAKTTAEVGGGRGGCVEMDIAVATDYTLYEDYQTPAQVLNQVEGVMNNVNGNYQDDFSSSITTRISELYISACPTCDPWHDGQDALTILESFRDWSVAGGFESDYDLGQFWSQRNYTSGNSGSVIGMAFLGAACSNNNYHILEDFTNSAGYLRVMTAHEIGHNLGCSHNFEGWDPLCYAGGRPDHIMDPSVSLANVWSDGEGYNCEGNSKGLVNSFLASNDCLSSCTTNCAMIDGLVADFDYTTPALSLNWATQSGSDWQIIVRNLQDETLDTFQTNETSLILTDAIDLCSDYEIAVRSNCTEGAASSPYKMLIATEKISEIKLGALQVDNCELDDQRYDLNFEISYEETFPEGFTVWLDEQPYTYTYTESPQQIAITNLITIGRAPVSVKIVNNHNGSLGCAAKATYYTPDEQCTWRKEQNFNDCQLPVGWRTETTYGGGNQWLMGDSTRQVLNFGTVQNSFDGSCMLYFDDDILGPDPMYSGTARIYTAVERLADYAAVELSLVYNFNAFYTQPFSKFQIDVFDGQEWVNILTDDSSSGCTPSQSFGEQCHTYFEANLSEYANDAFQIRFSYSDGGHWGEFVALDNFELRAAKSAAFLPVELTDFQAKKSGEVAELFWETAQEINNVGFAVERSTDGRIFSKIGFVAGAGDTNETQFYNFTDTYPANGVNYYRLRQEDTDGQFAYSAVRQLSFDSKTETWQVFPNPVRNGQAVKLRWQQEDHADLDLTIYSANGQEIAQHHWDVEPGFAEQTVNMSDLPVGIYHLRLSNGWQQRVAVVR